MVGHICFLRKTFRLPTAGTRTRSGYGFSISLLFLFSGFLFTSWAGGYSDGHSDGALPVSEWKKVGDRTWTEANGVVSCADQTPSGFLIRRFPCFENGEFSAVIKPVAGSEWNNFHGGIVFRSDTLASKYYAVALHLSNLTGQADDNQLRFRKNSTDLGDEATVIKSGLSMPASGAAEIKIRVSGNTFAFYFQNDSIGEYTDTVSPLLSGNVGYFYDAQWNGRVTWDSSSWVDEPARPVIDSTSPSDTTVLAGETVNLNVKVSGPKPYTYEWYKDGEETVITTDPVLTIESVSADDNGSGYFCIVTNETGSDTSRIAILSVLAKPSITLQPLDTTVYDGDSASFTVEGSGAALSYRWIVNDEPVDDTTPSLKFRATIAEHNYTYMCVVSNPIGSDTSRVAVLKVLDPAPAITLQPSDTAVSEGNSASFTLETTGKPPIYYSWFKKGSSSAMVIDSVSELTIGFTQKSDGGDYYCLVSNLVGGPVSSDTVTLTVNDAEVPIIISQSSDMIVWEAQSVTFEVIASGSTPLIYAWYKDKRGETGEPEVLGDSSRLTLENVTSDAQGMYYCMVSNSLGSTTSGLIKLDVKASNEISNPIIIKGQFHDRTHISLTVQNFSGLPSLPASPPYVDTIGIWYNAGSSLDKPDPVFPNLVKIPLTTMLESSSESYSQIIPLNPGPEECFHYYFSGSVFWHGDGFDSISEFTTSSICSTYMCSTTPIVNQLVLNADYAAKSDSVNLSLTNLSSIDKDALAYLIVSYGNDDLGYTFDTIPPEMFPPEPSGEIVRVYKNAAFSGESQEVNFSVKIRGILGNESNVVSSKIEVGVPRPENKAVLSLKSASSSEVGLSWVLPPEDNSDSVRIWYGTESIPLNYEIDENTFMYATFFITDNSAVISNLSQSTTYYFGLQVLKNGLWSVVRDSSSISVTTPVSSDSVPVPNSIKITDRRFDESKNLIIIQWTIDRTGMEDLSLQTGITWSTSTYPKNEPSATFGRIVDCTSKTTTVFTDSIDLKHDLAFDNLYYFALWLTKVDGLWSDPTDSSKDTVRIPPPKWQAISYFKSVDTISVLNNKLFLWKSKNWTSGVGTIKDTLNIVSPDSVPKGLIPVSMGVDFEDDNTSPALFLGMRPDSIPAGYSLSDVHLYSFDNTTGKMIWVNRNGVDEGAGIIFTQLKLSEHTLPFILMVDTMEPRVSLSDTASAVSAFSNTSIPVQISDNVANVRLELWASKGADEMNRIDTFVCNGFKDSKTFLIPSELITEDNGVRAELVVSDGHFTNKINMSRSVLREKSDPVGINPETWTSLATTAVLNDVSVEKVLDELGEDGSWKYDPVKFRIFRWVPRSEHQDDTTNWIEYSDLPEIKKFFDFTPGRVIWIKTREAVTIDLGPGRTTSLKQNSEIRLRAKDWTDIALPHKFDVKIADILTTSDLSSPENDSIWFFEWENSGASKGFYSTPLHFPPIPDKNVPGKDLKSSYAKTFTVYNNLAKDVVLKIPPLPASMSTYSDATKKRKQVLGWSIKVAAQTEDETLSPVYFAYTPGTGEEYFPVAPTINKVRIHAFNEKNNTLHGHFITHEMPEGGCSFPLVFQNSGNDASKIVTYSIDRGRYTPEDINVVVFDPHKRALEKSAKVTLNEGESQYRYVLAGSEEYIAEFQKRFSQYRLSLSKVFPNPFSGSLNISFAVPWEGVKRVNLVVYDQLGRTVWKKEIEKGLRPGPNSVRLNPVSQKLATGTYLLHLTAYNSKGKITGQAQSRIMYLK